MARQWAPSGPLAGGCMQVFEEATSAHTGWTPGEIIAGTDTQGAAWTGDQMVHWQMRNYGLGIDNSTHQVAAILISKFEVISGNSVVYLATGESGNNGGMMVSADKGQTWQRRTTAVQFAGNSAAISPARGYRSTGRLWEEDAQFTYAGTYSQGVKRSATRGSDNFPVTFTATGSSGYVRAIFLDTSGTLWAGFYPTNPSLSNGGLWKCTNPQAANPVLTQVTIPTATGNEVEDIFVLDGVVYIACGNNGVFSSVAGSSGSWGSLNGGVLDTSAGNSVWSSIDGYLDSGNNHNIVVGCSNGIKTPTGAKFVENGVMMVIPNHGKGAVTYNHMISQGTINTSTIPGYGPAWCQSAGLCLGQNGFFSPYFRFGKNDATKRTFYTTGSMGPCVSTNIPNAANPNPTVSWQLSVNGYSAFLGHAMAADPNNAGWFVFGDSDWGGWKVTGDGAGATGNIIRNRALGAQNYSHAYDPFTSDIWCGSGPKYCSPNNGGSVAKQPYNGTSWVNQSCPAVGGVLGLLVVHEGDVATGDLIVVAVALNDGVYQYRKGAWSKRNSVIGTVLNSQGTTPGIRYPIAYDGQGVMYVWDRLQGLFRSNNYGDSWSKIDSITSSNLNSAEIACNPTDTGELWVSQNGNLWQYTGADSGVVPGGITKTAITPPGGGTGSLVGATVNQQLPTPTQNTRQQAADYFDGCFPSRYKWAYSAQKVYYQNNPTTGAGVYPTAFVDGNGADITALVTGGCQIWLCYQPNVVTSTTERNNFIASVQWWLNNHPLGAAGIRVILWQEPQNGQFGFSQLSYQQLFSYYAPSIQALTDPNGKHAKVVYDAAGHSLTTDVPTGAAYQWLQALISAGTPPDEVVVDFYGTTWQTLTNGGTTNLDPVGPLRELALANLMPFGFGEIGQSLSPPPDLPIGLFPQYINYIISCMLACPPTLRTAVMWYDANRNNPNTNTVVQGDSRIPVLEGLYDALANPSNGQAGPVFFDSAGNVYVATQDIGSGSNLYVCTGPSPTGASWTICSSAGDLSFSQSNENPENGAVGPDGHVYVSGSNTVTQGFLTPPTGGGTSGAFTPVQGSGNITGAAGTLALALPAVSTAGTMLLARIITSDTSQTITPPTGWRLLGDKPVTATNGIRVLMYAYFANPGGLYSALGSPTAANFTYSNGSASIKGRIHEWSTPAGDIQFYDQPAAVAGTAASATSLPVAEANANAYTGGMAAAVFGANFTAGTGQSWTAPGGWTNDGVAQNTAVGFALVSETGLAAGTTSLSEGVTLGTSVMNAWAGLVVTFAAVATTVLTVTTATVSNGMVGVLYHQRLAASGGAGPYSWAVSGGTMPAGWSLSSAGVISGTATSSGSSTFQAMATDANGQTAVQSYTVTIYSQLIITTTSLPAGQTRTPYSQSLAVTGGTGPDTWMVTSGSLSGTGMTLSSTGVLSGTSRTPFVNTFVATVTDANGFTASQQLTLSIVPATLAIFDYPGIVDSLVATSQVIVAATGSEALGISDTVSVLQIQPTAEAEEIGIVDSLAVTRPGAPPWTIPFTSPGSSTTFVTSLQNFEIASPQIGQEFQIAGPGISSPQVYTITGV